jgi:tripartite-type tricarboxylate transporter receptor subunit TctC
MKLPRRQFLHLAAGVVPLPTVSRIAWAQAYPTRPVRIIVPAPAGGSSDILARLMGQWLSERLAQPFLVESRPGATGNIGTEAVVRAPADGYTLLLANTTNAINAAVYDKLNFNFIRDIVPVAGVMSTSHVMVVYPSVPAKTIPEFIAYARSNPAKVTMASAGIGSNGHITGEMFKMRTGVNMLHVPYRGGAPAVADLVGGQVQVMFAVMLEALEYIRDGKVRALAVTTAARSELLPDIPTVADFLPGFEASFWVGIGAPKNTPAGMVEKLNKEIIAGLADPRIRARLADLGGTPLPGSPAEFGKFIADETEKWGKVARAANIKV